ncbi:MAG: helix-turn-helix transcriptional regulator [Fermentimonas sp.]|jgi:AraC-like DNA-binding protein|nr:helix-turn-helix transcriptional regulator [Fermentimonas sp.]MBP6197820.1 helix-turn-helix transcriptional regulator [Fermentimonas sp.]
MIYFTKQLVKRLNGSLEVQYSSEGDVIYSMKLPLEKEIKVNQNEYIRIHRPVINEIAEESVSEMKIDTEFLDRITTIIYREILNTENLIEVISSELCLSSSQLNRRIKLMTGMTTSNFILKTRLNRARKQLSVTQKQIGEVAMDCGFNDFAYFSRSFKKEFGMTPSSFQRLNNSLN